jgi:CheY-like chemotaxis protein
MEPKVLIVDDNQDAADTLSGLIELLGCQVKATYDGSTALAALESFQPSMVLLDIGMPGMDGYEVAREIKSRHAPVVLVAVTGWAQEDDQRRTREAGFDHHLIKPVAFEALKALLSGLRP